MKINIKKIVRPYVLAWLFAGLVGVLLFENIFIRIDSRKFKQDILKEQLYIREKINVHKILSENDRYIKVTRFYSAIMSVYGVKYNHRLKKQDNGLNHYQKADVILEMYELSKLLNLPVMLLPALAAYESAYRPGVKTEYETGLFQHRPSAVGQAKLFYDWLPKKYKKKLAFTYNNRDDLTDPVNAIRIQAVLLWGYKKMFNDNQAFYISASHWGLSRIMPIYKAGIRIKDKFVFNRGTIKEDARNPLMYFYIINQYVVNFENFDLKIGIENGYIEKYKQTCSRYEKDYLNSWKFIKSLQDDIKKIEELKAEKEKMIAGYNEKIKNVDKKYREIYSMVHSGKYDSVKKLFKQSREDFYKILVDPIIRKKADNRERWLSIMYIFILIILITFSFIGFYSLIKKIRG